MHNRQMRGRAPAPVRPVWGAMWSAVLICGVAGAATAAVAAGAPDVRPGMRYATARANLIRAGVMPENVGRHHSPCPLSEEPDGTTECDSYPELIECSSGQIVICSYLFAAGNRYVVIEARGELPARATVVHFRPASKADLAAVERIR